jgi:putative hydrolase of the HAD superfamily
MNPAIKAVVFDLGGTLEDLYYDDVLRLEATHGLQDLMIARGIETGLSVAELYATLMSGLQAYQDFRDRTLRELPPEQVWPGYIFPGCSCADGALVAAAEDLTFFFETRFYRRTLRPEAPCALATLAGRGLRLAVISNVMSRGQVPYALRTHGIAHHFDPVVTSVGLGWRKPSPRIFEETARLMELLPAACAYVGDTISRDVIGSRRAGYGLSIQIKSFLTERMDRAGETEQPDALVTSLDQILDILPGPLT